MIKYGIRCLEKSTGRITWCHNVYVSGNTADFVYDDVNEAFKSCNTWPTGTYYDYWVEEYK